MKTYWFLFWGYAVIWAGIAGYVAFLLGRLSAVTRKLDRLEREVARVRPPGA